MADERSTTEAERTRDTLRRRFRCVAFAALGAGVTVDQLQEGIQVAIDAEERRQAAESLTPRPRLRVVSGRQDS